MPRTIHYIVFLSYLILLFYRPLQATDVNPITSTEWELVKAARNTQQLTLRLYLYPKDPVSLEETLYSISTPGNKRYGRHLSREDALMLAEPSKQHVGAIINWASAVGINHDQIRVKTNCIKINTTLEVANRILETEYFWFEDSLTKRNVLSSLNYTLPNAIAEYVAMVQPGHLFSLRAHKVQAKGSTRRWANRHWEENQVAINDIFCNHNITPSCLKDLYHINHAVDAMKGGQVGFTSFLGEKAQAKDMELFQERYAPWALGQMYRPVYLNGATDDQKYIGDASEGNLDSQYFMAVVSPLPVVEYIVGGQGPLIPDLDQPILPGSNEPYLEFLEHLLQLDDADLPHTITSSYGENEQEIPVGYAQIACNMLAQLGARGVSVLVSSGDAGVGQACQANDGSRATRFNPIFPASCPYVTSVGGTVHIHPEHAIEFSSGGFSEVFSRPTYQDRAVPRYLDRLGDTWAGLYNSAGRGFPDVAAQSASFTAIDKGVEAHISGTSAAAPVFAGIIAVLNAERVAAGMPPLGFLNPWLYSEGYTALNDVTRGGSNGCLGKDQYSYLTSPVVPFASWNATELWDPVTGLGTPDLPRMRKLVGPSS